MNTDPVVLFSTRFLKKIEKARKFFKILYLCISCVSCCTIGFFSFRESYIYTIECNFVL